MPPRTSITIITGPLGSGKTTLLHHILATQCEKIAIVMNEFGEIAIDTKVIEGKNVRIAELGGGCVCCSLVGEFEAAVNEIIEKIAPERIVVETTGRAEPEAPVFNLQEALPARRRGFSHRRGHAYSFPGTGPHDPSANRRRRHLATKQDRSHRAGAGQAA